MISVKVSYIVNKSFVSQNQKNINLFLMDLKKLTSLSFMYNVYLKEDGLTFLHISMYENNGIQDQVLSMPSFIHFQKERDQSELLEIPKIEILSLIGSSLNIVL